MSAVFGAAQESITTRVQEWSRRAANWDEDADALVQRKDLVQRRVSVQKEKEIADRMVPERQLVRPLLVVVRWITRSPRQGRNRSWPRVTR